MVLDAATPAERQSKEMRSLKLEAYEHQMDMIKEEQVLRLDSFYFILNYPPTPSKTNLPQLKEIYGTHILNRFRPVCAQEDLKTDEKLAAVAQGAKVAAATEAAKVAAAVDAVSAMAGVAVADEAWLAVAKEAEKKPPETAGPAAPADALAQAKAAEASTAEFAEAVSTPQVLKARGSRPLHLTNCAPQTSLSTQFASTSSALLGSGCLSRCGGGRGRGGGGRCDRWEREGRPGL